MLPNHHITKPVLIGEIRPTASSTSCGRPGLSLGSVLLLAAIGLAITFGVMGVINMAHGEMVMIGAYTTFVVQQVIRATNPGLFDWSLLIAIPLAFLVAGRHRRRHRARHHPWLYGRPLETLLATWGVSLILQQAVRTIFGPTNRRGRQPAWMQGSFEIFGHRHDAEPALDHGLRAGPSFAAAPRVLRARASACRCAR
jgi:urea transport system permease protein